VRIFVGRRATEPSLVSIAPRVDDKLRQDGSMYVPGPDASFHPYQINNPRYLLRAKQRQHRDEAFYSFYALESDRNVLRPASWFFCSLFIDKWCHDRLLYGAHTRTEHESSNSTSIHHAIQSRQTVNSGCRTSRRAAGQLGQAGNPANYSPISGPIHRWRAVPNITRASGAGRKRCAPRPKAPGRDDRTGGARARKELARPQLQTACIQSSRCWRRGQDPRRR